MKESNEILDRIELYTTGKMSSVEKLAFEKELAANDGLRQQFEFSQLVDQMVIVGEASKLRKQMGKDLNKPNSRISTYLAAALIVAATCSGLYFLFNKNDEKVLVKAPVIIEEKVSLPEELKEEKTIVISEPVSKDGVKTSITQEKQVANNIEPTLPETNHTLVQPVTQNPGQTSGTIQPIEQPKAMMETPKTEMTKKDVCAGLIGEVEFYTVPSCKGQETGEVHLKSQTIKGGQAPFTITLGNKSGQNTFRQLAAGQYAVIIRDANGCSVENNKKAVVSEKRCVEKKEYVFNPEYDPSWPIPFDTEKNPQGFKVFDKSGKMFYQVPVSSFQPADWKGESNTGLVLGMGMYFFSIEYTDGSVDEGSIVVSR